MYEELYPQGSRREPGWGRGKAANVHGFVSLSYLSHDRGGSIGIHGVNAGYDSAIDDRNNWTNGCIALKTRDVHDLYEIVSIGTGVKIE